MTRTFSNRLQSNPWPWNFPQLLVWLLPACAALWFLEGFGNSFLLNSAIGNHQIFPTDNILRFRALTQHFTGSKTNISSIPRLSISTTISNSVIPTATTLWDPTRSTRINPSHSPISPATPSTAATAACGTDRTPACRCHDLYRAFLQGQVPPAAWQSPEWSDYWSKS